MAEKGGIKGEMAGADGGNLNEIALLMPLLAERGLELDWDGGLLNDAPEYFPQGYAPKWELYPSLDGSYPAGHKEGYQLVAEGRNEDNWRWNSGIFPVEHKGVVIGVLFFASEEPQGHEGLVFVPRMPDLSSEQVVEAFAQLVRDDIEIVNGAVVVGVGEARERMVSLGVLEPWGDDGDGESGLGAGCGDEQELGGALENAARFSVPRSFGYRQLSLTERDDSPGKIDWRARLGPNFLKVFPGGYESLPKNSRKILIFPGVGFREVNVWRELGFQDEDFVLVERGEGLAEEWRRAMPGALVCQHDFKGGMVKILREIRGKFGRDERFAVVNIDPENKYSTALFRSLQRFFSGKILADQCFMGLNLSGKREGDRTKRAMICEIAQFRLSGGNPAVKILSLKELRRLSARYLLERASEVASTSYGGHPYDFTLLDEGDYEGDGGFRMHWAMHKLTRPQK